MIPDVQPALLAVLHPTGFHDMRAFFADKRSQEVANVGYPAENLQGAVNFVKRWQDRDIYVGVAARIDAQSRDLPGCGELHALFVDLDFKDSSEIETRTRLATFALSPSAVIMSGGGLQVYWFLLDAIDLQHETDKIFARSLLVSLATELHGDMKSAEPARILRVPGSKNYKYDPPRRVLIEAFDSSVRYAVSDFLSVLPIVPLEDKQDTEPIRHGLTTDIRMRLARRWLELQEPAIEHEGGDNHTYSICCSIAHGHDLNATDTFEVLETWNKRCKPPWDDASLKKKIKAAIKSAAGPKGEKLKLVCQPGDPMKTADEFCVRHHYASDTLSLRHQASVFYGYNENAGAYHAHDEPSVRAALYKFLNNAEYWVPATRNEPAHYTPFHPNKSKVENALDALRAVCNLPTVIAPPCWLNDHSQFNPLDMLACPNGLLHIPTRTFHMKTPHFYTQNGIDFNYDPYAPEPVEWLKFLASVWSTDQESIDTLQEIFGYFLTPDTRLQKIMMLVGDKRSGKGIIGRICSKMVGELNTCSPTLSAFGQPFGKQLLLGKTVAIVTDARISGHTDTAMVAEALLSISGEDSQSIARKFMTDWSGKLAVRFMLLTNELPKIVDVSGALASRFIVLRLTESFLGREDHSLFARLEPELPSILKWALDGRDRLYTRGHLLQPGSADDLITEFGDLGSPESAFLRDCTVRKAGACVSFEDLFAAWQTWCRVNGREHPGTAQTFGRNVRAAFPWATARKLGPTGSQKRYWEGMGLKVDAQ